MAHLFSELEELGKQNAYHKEILDKYTDTTKIRVLKNHSVM